MQNGKEHMHARPPILQNGHSHVSPFSSPSTSPAHSPRQRNGRSFGRTQSGKTKYHSPGFPAPRRTFLQRLTILLVTFFLKRPGVLLLAPFIYVTGMVLFLGGTSLEMVKIPPPGSIYRSDQVFEQLWPEMESADASSHGRITSVDHLKKFGESLHAKVEFGVLKESEGAGAGRGRQVLAAWEYPKEGGGFTPCLNHVNHDSAQALPESNGFLMIEANGGLNQQRSTICNAVAVAKLLNATLIIPHFHLNSVWKDPSTFRDIFDEDHFIESLARQVKVLRNMPEDVMAKFDNASMIHKIAKVKAWSLPRFYLETALPQLKERGAIRFSPFANRLAYDGIPKKIQKLRCFTNFVALRFAAPIADMGNLLVRRMVAKSANTNGNYVAIHLRFEEDMVAFSQCVYKGDKEEKLRLDTARELAWRGKFNRTGRPVEDPKIIRINGKCPLTPVEVGMMLRGMGFRNTTPVFLAAGKIYREGESMEPLRRMFPFLETKQSLLTPEEFAPFKRYSSRLAAVDYTVCLHSEVFVTTQGGNFPQILMGHRRFLNKGHSKTINPDKRRLALLLDRPNIGWKTFRKNLEDMRRHSDIKGLQLRKQLSVKKSQLTCNPKASLYTFPAPECMCAEFPSSLKMEMLTSQQ